MARRARSAAIQPFRPSVSGRIQPKWSAESRATSSPFRTVAARRRPTSARTRSAARRPWSALICLKPSTLTSTSESARSCRLARRASARSCSWKARWSGRLVRWSRVASAPSCALASANAIAGCAASASSARRVGSAPSATTAPQTRAPTRTGTASGAACPVVKTSDGGAVAGERDRRTGDECRRTTRLGRTDDRGKACGLEADDRRRRDAEIVRDLLGDNGEELDGIGLDRDGVQDPLLRGPRGRGDAVQDRDDAGHGAELVAACDPAALQRDVGAVPVQVAVRPVLGEHVLRVDEVVDRRTDELVRGVAEDPSDRGRAGEDDAILVELEHECVGRIGDEAAGVLLLCELQLELELRLVAPAQPEADAQDQEEDDGSGHGGADRDERRRGSGRQRDLPGAAADRSGGNCCAAGPMREHGGAVGDADVEPLRQACERGLRELVRGERADDDAE